MLRNAQRPSVAAPEGQTETPRGWRRAPGGAGKRMMQIVDDRLAGLQLHEGESLAEPGSESWGQLPALALIGACGLLAVAMADVAARRAEGWAEPLFWVGLLCLYLPITLRLAWPTVGRREGFGLVLALGLGLYLVKVMHSPLTFTFTDEFSHWRTAEDILLSGRLFQENPLLPVSALYPGLEIVTAALASIGNTSLFDAGIVVVGVARLLLVVSLYSIFEIVSRSPRVAGLATVIYMANPNYLFFSSAFSYESVALPVAALAILVLLHRQEATGSARLRLTAVALLTAGLVVSTHHLTSYALLAFLLAWLATARLLKKRNQEAPSFLVIATSIASLLWLATIGSVVLGYLAPRVTDTVSEFVGIITGQPGAGRLLFESKTGYVAPLWERLVGIAPAPLILAGLPLGLLLIWRGYRQSAVPLVLAVLASVYPLSLMLRLTVAGWEIGNRLSEYVFVGIAFALALAVVTLVRPRQSALWPSLVALSIAVMFTGGVIAGWPPAWRMPAPMTPGADLHPADPEAIAAAQWARASLGSHNNVGAESIHFMLMGSYGRQNIETTLSGGVDADWVIYAPRVASDGLALLRKGMVEYIVVDRRDATPWRRRAVYYPGVPREVAIAKFDDFRAVSRVFDSGNVQIYDVRQLRDSGDTSSVR